MLLAIFNGGIDQFGVLGLLRGRKDEGRVCGGILRLVFLDCGKFTAVTDDGGAGSLELIE
jgi:hypothetical protein